MPHRTASLLLSRVLTVIAAQWMIRRGGFSEPWHGREARAAVRLMALARRLARPGGVEVVEESTVLSSDGRAVHVHVTAAMRAAEAAEIDAILASGPLTPPAWQLENFRRTFSRYSRAELASVGADVVGIPGAAEAIATEFDQWDAERTERAERAAAAVESRSETAAAVASIVASLLSLLPLILRRVARLVLRPVTPRAPSSSRLA